MDLMQILEYLYSIKTERSAFPDDCRMIDNIIATLLSAETDISVMRKTIKNYGELFGDWEDWSTDELAIVTEIREERKK